MSNEITYQAQLLLRSGQLADQFASGSKTANQTTAKLIRNVQTIPTTVGGTALELGDIASPGVLIVQNLDADVVSPPHTAHFVDIGIQVVGVFYPAVRVLPGEIWMARYSPGAASMPYALADIASVELFYIIYAT